MFDPVRRPGPEYVDEHHRHKFEQVQVHTRAASHVGNLGHDGGQRLGGINLGGSAEGENAEGKKRQGEANHC